MNPEQPNSQYDFILNEEKKFKAGTNAKGPGGGMMQRIVIFVLSIVGLLAVGVIVAGIISGSGGASTDERLITISAQQSEILRVATLGVNEARDTTAQNYASTVKATMQTDYNATQALITKLKLKADPAVIAAAKNPKNDKLLTSAQQNNEYDEVLTQLLQSLLRSYQAEVKAAYDDSSSKSTKSLLNSLYTNADALIGTPSDATKPN